MIAASGVDDVRDVLDHYNQESDPIQAFLLRQQALLVRIEMFRYMEMRIAFFLSRKRKNRNDKQQPMRQPNNPKGYLAVGNDFKNRR